MLGKAPIEVEKMAYAYTPTYYSSLHDSIASLCKTILPFSSKKRRLPAAERKLSEQQLENLKWQQDSFHQILNLMGLCREGIIPETEVTTFRTQILSVLLASPETLEPPVILRDKLLFLQELSYAKCISTAEHNSSKRLLQQRLAIQGFKMDARNKMISAPKEKEEEWSIIDLKDEQQTPLTTDRQNSHPRKQRNKGAAASIFSLLSSLSQKQGNKSDAKIETDQMPQNLRKEKEEERLGKSAKKQWGFGGGFEKWRKSNREDETTPLHLSSDTNGGFSDTKQINKRKLHPTDGSSSDFFPDNDKIPRNKIKEELSRIQSELGSRNPSLQFSNDQIAAVSTKLPVDKGDLKNFFPKSWCDRHGDMVLEVVKKEFKDHVGEMETRRSAAAARVKNENPTGWAMFSSSFDDENRNPFGLQDHQPFPVKQQVVNFARVKNENPTGWTVFSSSDDENRNPFGLQDHLQVANFADSNHMTNWKSSSGCSIPFETNLFCPDNAGSEEKKLSSESGFVNPFQVPSSSRLGS